MPYLDDARQFISEVVREVNDADRLTRLLTEAGNPAHRDLTIAEWAEEAPDDYSDAVAIADRLGFDLPGGDTLTYDAEVTLSDFLLESGGYGANVYKTVRVTLAGGGPAGWIEFTVDPEDDSLIKASVGYCDWFQTPVVEVLSDGDADRAFARYRADLLAESV